MYLDKFVHSYTGKIIMSIILGIGLATFFRTACKGRHCRIISSPPIEELEGQTYKFNDKCYTFEKNAINCNVNAKTVNIA
jgi:hypothetical protein